MGGNRCRSCLECFARFLAHDQIDVTLAVFEFLIGQAVEFVRQGANRFRDQANFGHTNGEFTGSGFEQGARCTENVANVVTFERIMCFLAGCVVGQEKLDTAVGLQTGSILQGRERRFSHDPLQHHATCNTNLDFGCFERFVIHSVVLGMNIVSLVFRTEIVWIGDALFAKGSQFGTAFGHDGIFILGGGRRFVVLCLRGHDAM